MYIIISDHQDSRQKKEAKAVLLSVKFCRGGLEWEGSLYEGGGWQLGEGFFFGNVSILWPLPVTNIQN